ncbi:MAG: ribonuclease P protein component, partial [Gammaproteobacteria bacterium]
VARWGEQPGPVTPAGAAQRLTLPAQRRLRRKLDFEAIKARGRRMGNGLFAVTARLNDLGSPRLGLAVASKTAGGSVERNRIRRVIRESFRLHQHELPAIDIVVSARARAKGAPNRELRSGIEELWIKVKAQCASLPSS